MFKGKKVTAIILVAGNSTRYGQNRNKNFDIINEKNIVCYSINAFAQNDYIDDILIAMRKEDEEILKEIVEKENVSKNIKFIIGGNTRQESVYNCITKTDSDIVIIQDGARPAIKQEYINKCMESMNDVPGSTIGVKSKDTIKVTDENNIVLETTKRSNTWLIQTPQCFNREILVNMHEKYKNEEVTDDCMLLEKNGYQVKLLEGDYTNIKVTTYEDLGIIQEFLKDTK